MSDEWRVVDNVRIEGDVIGHGFLLRESGKMSDCQTQCQNTSQCEGIVWTRDSGPFHTHVCKLLSNTRPEASTPDSSMTSAVIPSRLGQASERATYRLPEKKAVSIKVVAKQTHMSQKCEPTVAFKEKMKGMSVMSGNHGELEAVLQCGKHSTNAECMRDVSCTWSVVPDAQDDHSEVKAAVNVLTEYLTKHHSTCFPDLS